MAGPPRPDATRIHQLRRLVARLGYGRWPGAAIADALLKPSSERDALRLELAPHASARVFRGPWR